MSGSSAHEQDEDAEMVGEQDDDEDMGGLTSGDDSDYSKYWVDWFLSSKGNEYFCEVDEDYIADKFNLTGLNTEVHHYQAAMDLLNGSTEDVEGPVKVEVERAAETLYGLIHARYILTNRGLSKMLDKYKRGDFGKCPRVYCNNQHVLPVGLSDAANTRGVKLYCPKCADVYNPKSTRHASLDGAFFGTTFPHMLFQVYPYYLPARSDEKYVPRIFGFKIHPSAYLLPVQRPPPDGEDIPTVP